MDMTNERLTALRAQRDDHEAKVAARESALRAQADQQAEDFAAQQAASADYAAFVAAQAENEALARYEARRQEAEREKARRVEAARALGATAAAEHLDFATIRLIATSAKTNIEAHRMAGPGGRIYWGSVVPWFAARDSLVARTLPGGVKNEDEFTAFVAGVTEVYGAL